MTENSTTRLDESTIKACHDYPEAVARHLAGILSAHDLKGSAQKLEAVADAIRTLTAERNALLMKLEWAFRIYGSFMTPQDREEIRRALYPEGAD